MHATSLVGHVMHRPIDILMQDHRSFWLFCLHI